MMPLRSLFVTSIGHLISVWLNAPIGSSSSPSRAHVRVERLGTGHARAAAEHADSDDAPHAMPLERLGGGPGEVGKRGFDRRRPGVRWRQPEDGAGAGIGLVHNRRVASEV
jgi:hypothetical protein